MPETMEQVEDEVQAENLGLIDVNTPVGRKFEMDDGEELILAAITVDGLVVIEKEGQKYIETTRDDWNETYAGLVEGYIDPQPETEPESEAESEAEEEKPKALIPLLTPEQQAEFAVREAEIAEKEEAFEKHDTKAKALKKEIQALTTDYKQLRKKAFAGLDVSPNGFPKDTPMSQAEEAEAGSDEEWFATRFDALPDFDPDIVVLFAEASIHTVGEFVALQTKHDTFWDRHVDGIGEAKKEYVENFLTDALIQRESQKKTEVEAEKVTGEAQK